MKQSGKFFKAKAALAILISLIMCGCSHPENVPEDVTETEKSAVTVDDVSLKDSASIYADDDDDSVVVMYLTVSQGSASDNTNHTWEDVNSHSTYYYDERGIEKYSVKGILQVGDENGPTPDSFGYGEFAPNCTVTIRGKTSTRSPQKSYKINIADNEGYWRGQRTINLNKHVYDSARIRNKLSYDLLKTIPDAFSARTQFVHLYVKDLTESGSNTANTEFADYGFFTQVEQINKTYLRNHGLDENGQLYKANMFEFQRYEDAIKLKSDPDYDETAFEEILEIKGNDDHTKLIAMLDDLNNYSIPIEDIIDKYFDEDNYLTWLAYQMLTGNDDTTSQNFFLYSPQNGNKWYFISWDNDGAFKYEESVIYKGESGQYNYTRGVGNYWGSVLHQRMLKSETLRDKLDEKINYLRTIVTKEKVTELVNRYEEIVLPYISSMPDSMYAPRTTEEHKEIIKTIPGEMDYQYEFYKTSLTHPMPYFMALPETLDGQLRFGWDSSYDFNGEKIKYTFELAEDPDFKNVIEKHEDLIVPQTITDTLEPGQYFFRVTAENESGMTQSAMETYQDADGKKYYGVFSFYVTADGLIESAN